MEFLLVEGAPVAFPCDVSDHTGHAKSSVSTSSLSGSKSEQSTMADAVPHGMLRQCRAKSCENSYLRLGREFSRAPLRFSIQHQIVWQFQ